MKRAARFTMLLVITIIVIIFCIACANSTIVASISTPVPTESITVAPTATPSPIPTATPIFSEEQATELNQNMQDFLNKEGEFTPEKISASLMEFYLGNGIDHVSRLDMNAAGLGISSYQPHIQGYFFDYIDKEGRVILLLGFDGKDGARFITPVEIPFYFNEAVKEAVFRIEKSTVNNIDGIDYSITGRDTIQFGECREYITCSDRNSLLQQLDLLKGNVIVIVLDVWEYDVSDLNKATLEEEIYNRAVEYIDENNSKIGLSFGLLDLVTSNDIDYKSFMENVTNGDSSSILKIVDVNNIDDIDISKVPLTRSILFFEGILY